MTQNTKQNDFYKLLRVEPRMDYSLKQILQTSSNLLENSVKEANSLKQISKLSQQLSEKRKKNKINRILFETEFPNPLSNSYSFQRRKNSTHQTQQKCGSSSKSPQKKQAIDKKSISKVQKVRTQNSQSFRTGKYVIRSKPKAFTFGIEQIKYQKRSLGKQKINTITLKKNIQKINLLDENSSNSYSLHSHNSRRMIKNYKYTNHQESPKKNPESEHQVLKHPSSNFGPNASSIYPILPLKQKKQKLKIIKKRIIIKKKDDDFDFQFKRSKTNQITREDIMLCGWNAKYEDDSALMKNESNHLQYFFE